MESTKFQIPKECSVAVVSVQCELTTKYTADLMLVDELWLEIESVYTTPERK